MAQKFGFYDHCLFHTLVESSFFFFQAEDGIRDYKVTGVQTCALPISAPCGDRFPSSWFSPPAAACGSRTVRPPPPCPPPSSRWSPTSTTRPATSPSRDRKSVV